MSGTSGTKVEIRLELPIDRAELLSVLPAEAAMRNIAGEPATMRERVTCAVETLCEFAADSLRSPQRRWFESRDFTPRALLIALFGADWLDKLEADPSERGCFLPIHAGRESWRHSGSSIEVEIEAEPAAPVELVELSGRLPMNPAQVDEMVLRRVRERVGGEWEPLELDQTERTLLRTMLEVHPWHAGALLTPEAAEKLVEHITDLTFEREAMRELLGELARMRELVNAAKAAGEQRPEDRPFFGITDADVQQLAERMFEVVMDVHEDITVVLADEPVVERERWLSAARIAFETAAAARRGR